MRVYLLISLTAIAFHGTIATRVAAMDVHDMSQEEISEMADTNLSSNDPLSAIKYYEQCIERINEEEDLIVISLSLYTNLATSSSSTGDEQKAVETYRNASMLYSKQIEEIVENKMRKEVSDITAQAAFFLGMTYQDMMNHATGADAYAFASTLDPYHWAALANLGSVLQSSIGIQCVR